MTSNENKTLQKYSLRAYKEDVDVVVAHYRDIGFNKLVRHMITKLADRIREQQQDTIESAINDIGDIDV